MKHLTIIALLLTGVLACTSQTPEADSPADFDEEDSGAPRASAPEGAPAACVDENDDPIECELNSECCEGFECGYDPEGSTRIKTCIWAGG
jgi:hypothetical protein